MTDEELKRLKRLRPVTLHVMLADGGTRDVAVPNRRRRWESVAETLDALTWSRLECVDKTNQLLGVIDAGETEEEEVKVLAAPREYALLDLLIRAQQSATTAHVEALQALTRAFSETMAALGGRLGALERQFGGMLAMTQRAVAASAAGPEESTGVPDELVQMALMRFVQGGGQRKEEDLGELLRAVKAATAKSSARPNGKQGGSVLPPDAPTTST